jgi:glycosyltransferase involved in cell wall biosynthesis
MAEESKKIVFFQMLNDNSGSPKMLSVIITGLVSRGYSAELFTSSSEGGFLSGLVGVKIHTVYYRFFGNRLLTFFFYFLAQSRYFLSAFRYRDKNNTIFYVNTILPWGAILGARAAGLKVICHVHENFIIKNFLHRISESVLHRFAWKAIFVSDYLHNSYDFEANRKIYIYNSLSPDFISIAARHEPMYKDYGNILMACSLKVYKGINVFIDLAALLPQHSFTLVINSDLHAIKRFFRNIIVPGNLTIVSGINDLHEFYRKTQLVVNLSIPDLWVETFGLTLLEAMSYGIPVIAPPVGGVSELVIDGYNGYSADSRDIKSVADKVTEVFSDRKKYSELSANARKKASEFKYDEMIDKIENVIKEI